ncbi:MAG: flavodoxin [Acholeplasmataceae bacterium]|jgi:flavodoxin short chain|nr:flavodoxin [Acholeplasmataceae bacterium]
MAKVLIVYWSGTGNTEIMAEKIAEGLKSANQDVDLRQVSDVSASEVKDFDKIALGCPSMGAEVLEEDEFQPFFDEAINHLNGKKIALFGSYGWGDGEWMRNWVSECETAGANIYTNEGLMINETPDSLGEEECVEFGKGFADF